MGARPDLWRRPRVRRDGPGKRYLDPWDSREKALTWTDVG